ELILCDCKISEDLGRLASCSASRRLRVLDLSGAQRSTEVVKSLLSSPYLADLRSLALSRNVVADAVFDLASGAFPRLRRLALCNSHLSPEGGKVLAASSHLACLRDLDLSRNPIGLEGTTALLQSTLRLARLDLRGAPVRMQREVLERFGGRVVQYDR